MHPHRPNRTFNAALNGGMEIAATIFVFVLIGLGIDRLLGTRPVFVISLFLFAALACGMRYYYAYKADMERLEAELLARRRSGTRP